MTLHFTTTRRVLLRVATQHGVTLVRCRFLSVSSLLAGRTLFAWLVEELGEHEMERARRRLRGACVKHKIEVIEEA